MLKDLQKLGLTEKEARVYLAALELGETNIQRISKKSGIKRTTSYDIIESLKEKGLISYIKKQNRTLYYAQDPREIENMLEEKKNILKKIMPELLSITNLWDRKPKINFFEGVEGIKEIYKDMLRYPGKEVRAWIAETAFSDNFKNFFYDYFTPQRKVKKIWVRAFIQNSNDMREYKKREAEELRKSKIIPENFQIKASINLYGTNKISIIAFEEKIGLIIESEKIFLTLENIFEMLWEVLPN